MVNNTLIKKNSPYSVIAIISLITIVISVWLYTAHYFERNIIQTHTWLVKGGYLTTGNLHINKYMLTANIDKPIIKTSVDGVDVNYIMGDRLHLNYHVLTKTLTLQPEGDELIITDAKNNKNPLVTLSKKNKKNHNKYSLRFAKFIPTFEINDLDPASILASAIKNIKSIRASSKNSEAQISGMGTASAAAFKFTVKPYIKSKKKNEITLHIHDRYTLNEFHYVTDKDAPQPLNTMPFPKTTSGHSHMLIHLGDKSAVMTRQIVNEFMTNLNWQKLSEALEIESKSQGKQTFEGLARSSLSNMVYSGSKKTVNLHIDFNDIYSTEWKQEYLPLLELLSSLLNGEKEMSIPESDLLSVLPMIENHNPIKKTIDLDATFNDTHIKTKLMFGYTTAAHGAQLSIELPFKKSTLWNMIKQLETFTDQEFDTYIDGSITAALILKNSKAILDDIESIFTRCKKVFSASNLFKDVKTNREFAETALTAFGEKVNNNDFKIQVSYDTRSKKFNYDTARNAGDIMSALLPMIFSTGQHEHHGHNHAH